MPNSNYIQNPEQIARAHTHQNRALAMFDQGFTSEAARKDALDYLNRAYEVLVDASIRNALLSQRTGDGQRYVWDNKVAEELSYKNFPALHVWAPKHAELYAAYPAQVKLANVLRADRDAIKAAALVAKPKSKTRELAEARNAVAKICQICGRPILAERGKIAHHGYQRPGQGWQTASCYGAMKLPFEVSRDDLGAYIKMLHAQLDGLAGRLDRANKEEIAFRVSYDTGKYQGSHKVMGSFFAERTGYEAARDEHRKKAYHWSTIPTTFDEVKIREINSIKHQINETTQYIKFQQARYDAWKAVA